MQHNPGPALEGRLILEHIEVSRMLHLLKAFRTELPGNSPRIMLTDPSLELQADNPYRELGTCVRVFYSLFIEETGHAEYHLAR